MTLPYKPGTTEYQILMDGWSRGLPIAQRLNEFVVMGFHTTEEDIHEFDQKANFDMAVFFYEDDVNV